MVHDTDISRANNLVDILKLFFEYQPPEFEQWELAVDEFKDKVPELAQSLLRLIRDEHRLNRQFATASADFTAIVRQAINPNISNQAVEEMLIHPLLTERIFRTVFKNPDFANRNIIAREIEKVIQALTSRHFSRADFLQQLDRFYGAIDSTAATIDDYAQKQAFLNTIYEKFFQGFSIKVADTHGIVYTPQPIVDFMVRSVDDILQKEFGKSLGHKDVHILDPFVGTGNFILRIMRQIPRTQLPYKYAYELHCNEVMLLPYYIAAMNIEHDYFELAGEYKPFAGICLVDTFELVEGKQMPLFVQENTQRVERQKQAPIFVVIGNPPYNAWQVNENDNSRNRKYLVMDQRIANTYVRASKATLNNALYDPYVKAIRWASDRIKDEGVFVFVTNNSFLEQIAFDGMRKHLTQDFDVIYVLDLGGNVRKNPKLSGTTHNVFGIQVGVSITLMVRRQNDADPERQAKIYYARLDELWRKEQKYDFLNHKQLISNIVWQELKPDNKQNWLTDEMRVEFDNFLPMGTKISKRAKWDEAETVFKIYSRGVCSNNDAYVYNYSQAKLAEVAKGMVENYAAERDKWMRRGQPKNLEDFLSVDEAVLKWIRNSQYKEKSTAWKRC